MGREPRRARQLSLSKDPMVQNYVWNLEARMDGPVSGGRFEALL